VTRAEADIGVMAFGLGELADALHEGERLPEIAESKRALDAMGVIAQLPIRRLLLETQRFIARKRRNATATRRAGFFREGLGHVVSCNLALKLMAGGRSATRIPQHHPKPPRRRRPTCHRLPSGQGNHPLVQRARHPPGPSPLAPPWAARAPLN